MVHELLHSLGMLHEQSRPDRDDYVTINFGNIKNELHSQFKKYGWNQVELKQVGYDLGSVMHYGSYVSHVTLYIRV